MDEAVALAHIRGQHFGSPRNAPWCRLCFYDRRGAQEQSVAAPEMGPPPVNHVLFFSTVLAAGFVWALGGSLLGLLALTLRRLWDKLSQ